MGKEMMTRQKLLAVCFALAAAVNLFLFFVDGFPNYGNATMCAASATASYLIYTKLCRIKS